MDRIDHDVRLLADQQYGVFSARQLREFGASPAVVRWRCEDGAWDRLEYAIYRLPGAPDVWRQRLWIALLVAGPGAVVCRRTAAALWRLPGFSEAPIEILAQHGLKNHRLPRGRFRETRSLPVAHTSTVDGIPVTTVERTLFDLAGLDPKRADRAVENALASKLTSQEQLWELWSELAAPGRRGSRAMRTILLKRAPGYVARESELESRFSDLLDANGIEQPEWQRELGGEERIGRVDGLFRRQRVVAELDGRVGHVGVLDRARDRKRDNELTALGLGVLRFTWEDVVCRPGWVISTLKRALSAAA